MDEMIRRLPFHMRSLHCDTGSEFMNDHPVRFAKEHPKITFARSRTGCCNDNAHLKQKNSSLGCNQPSVCPMVRLQQPMCSHMHDHQQSQTRDQEGLHSSLRQIGHTGRTCLGASRADGHPELTVRHRKALLRRVRETNAISLFDKLRRSFARICSKQEDYRLAHQENAEGASAAAAAASDSAHPTEGVARPLRYPALLPPDTHYPTDQPPPSAPPSVSSK